ncbi:hypothetical protein SK128_003840 [Halocaridina rubra]|uniref:Uncharacterized protein n=1 Tax=Halocaridina rubra TaxID=373956 RepID=A0AAN8XE25_HALRR
MRPDSRSCFTPIALSNGNSPHTRPSQFTELAGASNPFGPHPICTIFLHSFLSLARTLPCSTDIPRAFSALFTPSIHLILGLPLNLTPITSALHTLFTNLSSNTASRENRYH